MPNKIFISIACFLYLLNGCRNSIKEDEFAIIQINPNEIMDEIQLSEIADSITYIKLQTDSNCVIGNLHNIIIKNKYIYAWDKSQQIIFVFDKKGLFVSKLDKLGKGPDEYLHIGGLVIDDKEEYVEIYNPNSKNSNCLIYSNIDFKLLEKKAMPTISANSMRKLGETYYFATQQIENIINNEITNAEIIVVKDSKIIAKLFDKNIETKNNSFSPFAESFTVNDKSNLFASIMYDNKFYQLDNTKSFPIYKVDFGKYSIDNSIGLQPLEEQLKYINNINDLASFPVLNVNNSDILIFSYWFKKDNKHRFFSLEDYYQYILLKKSNKIFHTKKIKNDLTNFPDEIQLSTYSRRVNHEVWFKNYLVDIILPGYYLRDDKEKLMVDGVGEIKIDDNPIVILIKPKIY